MFTTIRQQIGYRMLKSTIQQQHRERKYYNFETAQTIGIIFNADDKQSVQSVHKLSRSLKDRKIVVYAIGYYNKKTSLDFSFLGAIVSYFPVKDVNWYFKPINLVITDFCQQVFDIIIDLSTEDHPTLKYIIGLSKAKMKLGRGDVKHTAIYDLLINVQQDSDVEQYISQLSHYLTTIKSVA